MTENMTDRPDLDSAPRKSAQLEVGEVATAEESAAVEETTKQPVKVDSRDVREVIADYMSDPKVQENLRTWANHLNTRFHGNWFGLEQMTKKTKVKDFGQAESILNMLILAHLAHREVRNKIVKFKITLDKKDKVALLQKQVADLDNQKALLLKEIETLGG